jgi:four helix bundle protein
VAGDQLHSYRELIVWRKAMALVREVYAVTRQVPREELFGLTSQLRRAAVSVPSAIAEGNGRQRRRDYIRFLLIARGSLQEVETQLLIAVDLDYLPAEGASRAMLLADEVSRMLTSLVRSLDRLARIPPTRES